MPKKLTHEEFLEKLWQKNEHYRNGEYVKGYTECLSINPLDAYGYWQEEQNFNLQQLII
jgi:hypothetical protein